jgi:hypothetical protein
LRERLSARTENPSDSVESEELDIRLLLIESRMVGRAQIGDRAEERLAALDRKLELVARTERARSST